MGTDPRPSDEVCAIYDLPSLRITALSGGPGRRAGARLMDRFGAPLNLYGSTRSPTDDRQPEDLRSDPGTTASRARDRINLFDGRQRGAPGAAGILSARNGLEGYTAAGTRSDEVCSPAVTVATSTAGAMFIDGRDEEMIVPGENVSARGRDLIADYGA